MTVTVDGHEYPATTWDSAYIPFGARNGRGGGRFPDLGHGAWRHASVEHEGCEAVARLRCACPGIHGIPACCGRATQEDHLCDQCRAHCWAIDRADVYHRFVDHTAAP